MTANIAPRSATRPEPFERAPRCGGELVAGRLSGWYIRRTRPAAAAITAARRPEPTEALAAEGARR